MDALLKQAREAWVINIKENPSIATWSTTAMVDNGNGTMIPDPTGTTTSYSETVRLAHEKSGISTDEETPAGLGTSYSLFVMAKHDTNIKQGITITSDGRTYTVGAVDTLRRGGGIYGYHAPLTEVS